MVMRYVHRDKAALYQYLGFPRGESGRVGHPPAATKIKLWRPGRTRQRRLRLPARVRWRPPR